jgi:hypothetical protein
MSGQTIEAHAEPLAVSLIPVCAGLALLGVAAGTGQQDLAFPGLPLIFVGAALGLTRRRSLELTLTREAIDVHRPEPRVISYREIEGIATEKTTQPWDDDHFPILVLHSDGLLYLAPQLNVPSKAVYHLLSAPLPTQGSGRVPPVLHRYYESNVATFGAERVWSYHGRSHVHLAERRRAWWLVGALFLTSIIWIAGGAQEQGHKGWAFAGGFLLIPVLIAAMAIPSIPRHAGSHLKNWRNAGLVVTPVGLALCQGTLKGEMRWDELKRMQYDSSRRGLILFFAGGQIRIADIYDRPLPEIRHRLESYWQPPNAVRGLTASEGDY